MSFDFDAAVLAPFRMQPGLRRLAPGAPQLTASRPHSRHLREKLAVLGAFADQALLVRPGFDATAALVALSAHAAHEHPAAWEQLGDGVSAKHLGWSLRGQELHNAGGGAPEVGACLRALSPEWRLPGLMSLAFHEDFAILDRADASVPWLAVALPSHWAPEDKVGRSFVQVHAPVADNAVLLAASDHLVKLVTGDQRWERFVWTLTGHPHLHAHPARLARPRWPDSDDADVIAGAAWWRTERQTFIPVDGQTALFTIHVDSVPLVDALSSPAQAAQLHAALASMSEKVLAYRGLSTVHKPLLRWLAGHSNAQA